MRNVIFRVLGGAIGSFLIIVGIWMIETGDWWAVLAGIMIGIILLRFAATGRSPNFGRLEDRD